VNSWTPTLGGNFVAQFTARNYGEYRAHLAELRLGAVAKTRHPHPWTPEPPGLWTWGCGQDPAP
jgi:hypothetical protein